LVIAWPDIWKKKQGGGLDIPDPIEGLEQEWTLKTNHGGLIFAEKSLVPYSNATEYDITSAYPAKLVSDIFTFSLKMGEFKTMTSFQVNAKTGLEFYEYGIYKCIVHKSSDSKINRLFRFSKDNLYNHFDLTLAQRLGLRRELIQGEVNALLYKQRVHSHMAFGELVKLLFGLKKECALVKPLLVCLYGVLSERAIITQATFENSNMLNIHPHAQILSVLPCGDKLKIKYIKDGHYFKFDYARTGGFLTSSVRLDIASDIEILRLHTDGFVALGEPLTHLDIGHGLGQYKIDEKKKGCCMVVNSCDVKWNEDIVQVQR
jgi:hypothetical protein